MNFNIAELTAGEVAHILHSLSEHPKLQGKILTQFNDQLIGGAKHLAAPKKTRSRKRKPKAPAAPATTPMAPPPPLGGGVVN